MDKQAYEKVMPIVLSKQAEWKWDDIGGSLKDLWKNHGDKILLAGIPIAAGGLIGAINGGAKGMGKGLLTGAAIPASLLGGQWLLKKYYENNHDTFKKLSPVTQYIAGQAGVSPTV